MDKNSIINGKKSQKAIEVHRMPQREMQPVHRNYGLWILSSGNCKAVVDGFYRTQMRYFEYFSISHMHSGKGRLWMPPDREYEINPGDCVIMPPQAINRYGGVDGCIYEEDSICFTGPVAEMLYKTGIIRAGLFKLGKARQLLPIQRLASDPARDSQINANIGLQKLLIDIYNNNRILKNSSKTSSVIDPLLSVLKDGISRWWTVNEMAEYCGLSEDQFRRVFKKYTGMLPKLYIDRLKLRRAAEMLASSDTKVEDIAAQLDYRDCYHFSRRFKRIIGFSPRRYRREFGSK